MPARIEWRETHRCISTRHPATLLSTSRASFQPSVTGRLHPWIPSPGPFSAASTGLECSGLPCSSATPSTPCSSEALARTRVTRVSALGSGGVRRVVAVARQALSGQQMGWETIMQEQLVGFAGDFEQRASAKAGCSSVTRLQTRLGLQPLAGGSCGGWL